MASFVLLWENLEIIVDRNQENYGQPHQIADEVVFI